MSIFCVAGMLLGGIYGLCSLQAVGTADEVPGEVLCSGRTDPWRLTSTMVLFVMVVCNRQNMTL